MITRSVEEDLARLGKLAFKRLVMVGHGQLFVEIARIGLHPTYGEMDEFAGRGEFELALDVEAMNFDSLDAET